MKADYVELRGSCPYCEHKWAIDVRSVIDRSHALRCVDCKEVFVVKVTVTVDHSVHALADVKPDEVMDRLTKPKPTGGPPGMGSLRQGLKVKV